MASSPAVSSNKQADADFAEHVETWTMFITLSKWVIAACIIIMVGMAVFLL
jgi:Bacterial aa3 type cytochrome c oxidase subunit IV